MSGLSTRTGRIKPSPTLSVSQRAAELRAEGVDVVSFSAGEPDFDTPPHIVDAAKMALDSGMTRYTPVAGIPELRRAVAEESTKLRGIPCGFEQVVVTVGAKHALYEIFQSILEPGDEVIIPAPYWVSYPDQVLLADGVPVIVPTASEQGWTLTAEAFDEAITSKTKALVINTPSNPTGACYSVDALLSLAKIAGDRGIWLISDEIYRDLIYDGLAHASILSIVAEGDRERVVVVDGVSKTYAMTGWRVGWGIGNPDLIKAMSKVQGQSTSNPASMAQFAALAAITGNRTFLDEWRETYSKRRDVMVDRLLEMPGVDCCKPSGAFYALASFEEVVSGMGAEATDVTLATYLLDEARVAVVPGSAFGAPGHLRFSYATSLEKIEKGLDRVAEALTRI